MRRPTENFSPRDRRFYWKFVGALFAVYGALMVVMVAMLVANHMAKNRALDAAMAEAIGQKPPAFTGSVPARPPAKPD